jgi:predicted nucleotidyltransferase component of viral defense system
MKTSTQLKALIRNASRTTNVSADVLLRNYMMERLLERISVSQYRTRFILKGGMLVASMVGLDTRSTMDMDATITGYSMTEEELDKVMKEILAVQVDDGVTMIIKGYEVIRDDAEYPGIRVSLEAGFDKIKQPLKVDISTGDVITPKEIEYSYKLTLEDREIRIMAYNLETVLAEKIETILSRGTTSTRMRDYYDVHILSALRSGEIRWSTLRSAFQRTAEKRGSYNQISNLGPGILDELENSLVLQSLWDRYRQKNPYAVAVEWKQALHSLRIIYTNILLES